MRKARFSEEQMVKILRESESLARPRPTPAVANQAHAGQGIAVAPYFGRIEQMKRNAPDPASTRDYPAPIASAPRRALALGTTSPRRV